MSTQSKPTKRELREQRRAERLESERAEAAAAARKRRGLTLLGVIQLEDRAAARPRAAGTVASVSTASEPRTLVTHPEIQSRVSFPSFRTLGEPQKSALERSLGLAA